MKKSSKKQILSGILMTSLMFSALTLTASADETEANSNFNRREKVRNFAKENLTEEKRAELREKMSEKREKMQLVKENANRKVEKLEDGIRVTITTENEEILEIIQNQELRERAEDAKIEVSKNDIENGIVITRTSEDQAIVERMHQHADLSEIRQDITHSVENIENGLKITVTSKTNNAATIEHIQSKEPRGQREDAKIQFNKTNIENGVEITISSDDEELVEKIQTRAEKREEGEKRPRKGKRGSDKMRGKDFNTELEAK